MRRAFTASGASLAGKEVFSTPRHITNAGVDYQANEALRLGLVNRVVAKDSLVAEAEALVQRLAQGPTHALGHMKQLLRSALERELDAHLDQEAESFTQCAGTADFQEGISAFREKRAARFQGR